MMKIVLLTAAVLLYSAPVVVAQHAILPHGDPTIEETPQEKQQREEIRDQRLKQQGQGPHYRIEGEPQAAGSSPNEGGRGAESTRRQDTGMADPTVNPGQAKGTRTVRGNVLRADANEYVVRDVEGREVRVFTDEETTGDKDVKPGDHIVSQITRQGRAITITKEMESPPAR